MITTNLTTRNQVKLLEYWLTNPGNEQVMSKIVFVPLTDEMVFERPDMIAGPITTYQPTISERHNRSVSRKKSFQVSGAYLKGDLINGVDVVYVRDRLIRGFNRKKYRGLNRGI